MPAHRPVSLAAVLALLTGWLYAAAADPATDCYGDPLPDGAVARFGTVRFWAPSPIEAIAFSPDGRRLATGHQDQTIRLWDRNTGKEMRRLTGHDDPVSGLAFSPDGKLLSSRGGHRGYWQDNSIRLWDTATGRELRRFGGYPCAKPHGGSGPQDWAFRLAFSPDGKMIASGGGDAGWHDRGTKAAGADHPSDVIFLWDVATGQARGQLRGHEKEVRCFVFARDGRTLVSGAEDDTVRVWDLAAAREIRRWAARGRGVHSVALSPDGKRLATGLRDETVALWEPANGKELRRLRCDDTRLHWQVEMPVAFAPDGTALAWADTSGRVRLTDARTGKELRRLGPLRKPTTVAWSADGKVLAAVRLGEDRAPHLWATEGWFPIAPAGGAHISPVSHLQFSADGRRLASSDEDGTLALWDAAAGRAIRRIDVEEGREESIALAADGRTLAATDGSMVWLWEAATGRQLWRRRSSTFDSSLRSGNCELVALSPDGKTVAAAWNHQVGLLPTSFTSDVVLWDAATGREVRRFRVGHIIHALSILPDGKRLVTSEFDPTAGGGPVFANYVRLWDVGTGKELRRLPALPGGDPALAVSADGTTLAVGNAVSAGGFDTIQVWHLPTGRPLAQIKSERSGTSACIRLSPDGRTLADAGPKGEVCLWEVATGGLRRQFGGHFGEVLALAFAPDGKRIASGGNDASILLWDTVGQTDAPGSPERSRSPQELDQLWSALAGSDSEAAFRAINLLARVPAQAARFLAGRLRPVPVIKPARLASWVAALDSERFADRRDAEDQLRRIEAAAEPALRRAMAGQPALELRRRLEGLLDALDPAKSPAMLRTLRAIEALERAGTPEARNALQAWAAGAPGPRLTREAQAALDRLAGRTPAP